MSGASTSPLGGGSRATIASSTRSMLRPVLAEIGTASRGVDADHVLDLLLDAVGLGRRQVDLVEDRDDLVVGVDRLIDVGERLRLDALRGVDDEERALARRERARDLVGEVDMAGRVHQVEDIVAPVLGAV